MFPATLLHPPEPSNVLSQKNRSRHPNGPRRSVSLSLPTHHQETTHLTTLLSAFVFAILRATSLSLETSDTTYDYTLTGTWMTLEANIGLIASNIGPMYALLYSWWGKKSPSYYNTSQTLGASNARRDTRHPSLDDDSDRSLCMHTANDSGNKNIISGSESVNSAPDDIPMQRLSTADEGHAGHVMGVKA